MNTMNKTLTSIALAGAIALGVSGCGRADRNLATDQYIFAGNLGGVELRLEKDTTRRWFASDKMNLTATYQDGVTKAYKATNNGVVESVTASGKDLGARTYDAKTPVGQQALTKASAEFNYFLRQIEAQKKAEVRAYFGN